MDIDNIWNRHGISIHAPREGSDVWTRGILSMQKSFQSTLPVRGATLAPVLARLPIAISIHAPREGSDRHPERIFKKVKDFNPRSP